MDFLHINKKRHKILLILFGFSKKFKEGGNSPLFKSMVFNLYLLELTPKHQQNLR